MNRQFDLARAEGYVSAAQKARVLSEKWLVKEVYCPACGAGLNAQSNNLAVSDATCVACEEEYELKAMRIKCGSKHRYPSKIVDGAYGTMIQRLESNQVPNLFLLQYDSDYRVASLLLIPQHFFVPSLIEERPPLAAHARRAGWVGCNILLHQVPHSGKVSIVTPTDIVPKHEVIANYRRTSFLKESDKLEIRGWLTDTIACIERLQRHQFELADLYSFVPELSERYPQNKNIKAKLRQQMQKLREKGFLRFKGNGVYELIY